MTINQNHRIVMDIAQQFDEPFHIMRNNISAHVFSNTAVWSEFQNQILTVLRSLQAVL